MCRIRHIDPGRPFPLLRKIIPTTLYNRFKVNILNNRDSFSYGRFTLVLRYFRITLAPDIYLLQTHPLQAHTYRFELLEFKMMVRYCMVHSKIATEHQRTLATRPYVFTYLESRLKTHIIPAGSLTSSIPHLFINVLPKYVGEWIKIKSYEF